MKFMASGSCQKICKLTVHQLLANCPLPNSQLTDVLQLFDTGGGGGETPHMKGVGMLVGKFELNP